MKVTTIVNAMNKYYEYQSKIAKYTKEKQLCDVFDDESGKQEWQTKIDETNTELGNFLNIEV